MKIGFIGLGIMGGSIALRLCNNGHQLVVNDIRRDAAERQIAAGSIWVDTPREVGERSDVVFTSLPGPHEIESVALGETGLISGMAPGTTWFDLSTNSPTVIRRLHDLFAERHIVVLDAPVSGGPAGAESGDLALWVGGDRTEYDRFKPILGLIGDKAAYIGEVGAGSVAKLVHNTAGYAIQTALAEVFTLGVKADVPPLILWNAIRQGIYGKIRTFDGLANHFLPQNFDPPAFALSLAHKDVWLAAELGREFQVPMRVANLVLEEMTEAVNRGWGDRDSRVAMLLQEERAGVDIEVSQDEIEANR